MKASSNTLIRALRRRNLASMISNEIIVVELGRFLSAHFRPGSSATLLDLGSGSKPYEPLYAPYFDSCTAVDVGHSPHDITGVDVLADGEDLPFDDDAFDCVICTEMLEHSARPSEVVSEIARVLRRGGRVFLTTPFLRPLHEMPHDYYRFTPPALKHLAEDAGLVVESTSPRGEYAAVLLLTLLLPVSKLWQQLARRTRGLLPYSARNPLVYATIVAPQLAYLLWWRAASSGEGPLHRVYCRLSYYTLGYVTVLRPADVSRAP